MIISLNILGAQMNKKFLLLSVCLIFKGYSQTLEFKAVKSETFMSISPAFLRYMQEVFDLNNFVETGTFMGETSGIAAEIFKDVYSVELGINYYTLARSRLKHLKNVHLYHGESPAFLQEILKNKNDRILFWLDAHCSGGSTAKSDKNTPILEELDAIRKNNIKNSVILIDDLRCFQSHDQDPADKTLHGYPTFKELYDAIKAIDSRYKILAYGDCALAYTSEAVKPSLALKLMTQSRKAEESPEKYSLNLEENFKLINSSEKEEITKIANLFNRYSLPISPYNLWLSIFLTNENKKEEAKEILRKSIHPNYQPEKIAYYLKKLN